MIPQVQMAPGAYLVIAASRQFYENFPAYAGPIAFLADGRIGNGLSNLGDRLVLRDENGHVVDALSYGNDNADFSPPCPEPDPGQTLERSPAGHDTDAASDFVVTGGGSPGAGLPLMTASVASLASTPGP